MQTSKACLALLFCFLSIGVSLAQNRTISGTVTDTQNQPVIGAAVMVVGNTRISEVAYLVGYTSPSYFTKHFQQQFGMTPSEFIHSND